MRSSPISPEFAQRTDIGERLRILRKARGAGAPVRRSRRASTSIEHPYLTVGRERYDRVAASVGIEPRDPFLDLRVLSFCVSLPDGQMLTNGWPKSILRRATADLLPDEVRWRCGKEHLGWAFTNALLDGLRGQACCRDVESNLAAVGSYVGLDAG